MSGHATWQLRVEIFTDHLKVSFTPKVLDLCFFSDRFSSVHAGFKMNHFPGDTCFGGLVPAGVMTLKPRFKILGLAYVETIQRSGVQYVYKIFHKKARLGIQPGLTLVGVAGFEPTTPCTPCKYATGLRYTPRSINYYSLFQFQSGF